MAPAWAFPYGYNQDFRCCCCCCALRKMRTGPLTVFRPKGEDQSNADSVIKVTFSMRYGDGLSQAEDKPRVFVYMSDPVEMVGEEMEIDLPLDDADKRIEVTIEGRHDSSKPLPTDTKICFYTTSESPNDFGAPCRVDAGFGMIDLNDMLSANQYERDVPLKLYSCGGFVKGMLRVQTTKRQVKIDSRIRWETDPISASMARLPNAVADNTMLDVEMEMMKYISAVMKTEQSFPNTFEETGNVRIPIYYGDVGMIRPKAPLPAAAFFMAKVPKSNTFFWTNAMDVVLARNGQVRHDVDAMPLNEQASLMADIVCMVIQAMDYKSDTIDTNRRPIHASPGFIGAPMIQEYDPTKVLRMAHFFFF